MSRGQSSRLAPSDESRTPLRWNPASIAIPQPPPQRRSDNILRHALVAASIEGVRDAAVPLTGYRGIHDIYEYESRSELGSTYKGLFIELQFRTRVQHAWATAVELVGLITTSQPKFQEGDKRYEEIMSFASEILARAYEDKQSCHPDVGDEEIVRRFLDLDASLGLLNLLRGLNSSQARVVESKNMILVLKEGKPLEIRSFRYSPDALKALFELEAAYPGTDVVLVKGESADDVRLAFKNYFSDAHDFIKLVEDGCEKLSGKKVITALIPRRRDHRKPSPKRKRLGS